VEENLLLTPREAQGNALSGWEFCSVANVHSIGIENRDNRRAASRRLEFLNSDYSQSGGLFEVADIPESMEPMKVAKGAGTPVSCEDGDKPGDLFMS
jgi:hypothetical protein